MIILDTDHLSILEYPDSAQYAALTAALSGSVDGMFVATAISVEEEFRGWLAAIHQREKSTTKYCITRVWSGLYVSSINGRSCHLMNPPLIGLRRSANNESASARKT